MVILQCFLHAWLKIRDRAKHLKELFAEVSRRVWEAYHAPDRRCFGATAASLRQWAAGHLTGVVLEKVLDLCEKRDRWSIAYRHPGGHRTSNMLDRLMRGMNRYFDHGQHLHGSRRGVPAALPGVGVAVELRALASGDDAGERGLAVPRRATQPAPLPRLLAAEPVDLRVPGRIPMSTPPKSVTVSNFTIVVKTRF